MTFSHIIPTTGYQAVFSRLDAGLGLDGQDSFILPVLAFAVREGEQVCGLVIGTDGRVAVCEDCTFATFLGYVPPAEGNVLPGTVAAVLTAARLDDLSGAQEW